MPPGTAHHDASFPLICRGVSAEQDVRYINKERKARGKGGGGTCTGTNTHECEHGNP
jgi:hypothetical protein